MASTLEATESRLLRTRYVIRWSKLTENLALAASALGLVAVVARLI